MDDNAFFKILNEKHRDLLETCKYIPNPAQRKKYSIMVPPSKYITTNMLTRSFYDNHIFFQCEYDDKMMINLNGKVIQSNNNQFQTFLGFKKSMMFNVLEEYQKEFQYGIWVKCVFIDNVIEESAYNQNNVTVGSISKREVLKKYQNKDEYLGCLQVLTKKHDDLREIDGVLNDLTEKLQNNYILIKNHVLTYAKYFQEQSIEFRTVSLLMT
jgi:hypothetical protein